MKIAAVVGLVLYCLYSISFYAEGYRPRGGPALKALGTGAEAAVLTALIWEVVA